MGHYLIEKCYDNGSIQIKIIDEEKIPLFVNDNRLKLYKKPLYRVEFIDSIRQNMNFIESIIYLNPFNL